MAAKKNVTAANDDSNIEINNTKVERERDENPSAVAPISSETFKVIKRVNKADKVGPHGEDLILKRNRFYYLDGKGKKVRVRNSELKDKPKHS